MISVAQQNRLRVTLTFDAGVKCSILSSNPSTAAVSDLGSWSYDLAWGSAKEPGAETFTYWLTAFPEVGRCARINV
jgi:hypothetical protein